MIGLIQRVTEASVKVEEATVGEIEQGILLLLGVQKHDDQALADKLLNKVMSYRIFPDAEGKMNRSLQDINGQLLVVSQFTLAADTAKGTRPGFSKAAPPAQANELYDYFCAQAGKQVSVQTGQFGADMKVSLVNDGPVTFWLEV